MINIYLDTDTLEVGTKLSGSCLWTPNKKESNKTLTLLIGWRTEGRGDVDKETIYETEITPSSRAYFSCQIPPTGPVSYDGELLRIIWEVIISRSKFFGVQDILETKIFRVIARNSQ